jgi:hypothetical protein
MNNNLPQDPENEIGKLKDGKGMKEVQEKKSSFDEDQIMEDHI